MQAVALLIILGLATALPSAPVQLVEQEQEKPKGLLTKAADVVQKSATATAAAAAISRMADQIDGKEASSAGLVNPVSSIVKKHDKAQIAKLKATGKISEGFPDLAFVHIPKTGGDAVSMASTPIFPYGFGLRANLALNLMVDKKKQGSNFCYFEQLPPKEITKLYSKKVFEESYGKRTVFCSVRNPYERIVSQWQSCLDLRKGCNACTPDDLNSFVQKELTAFQKGDYLRGECQMIPQYDYTQGEGGCTKLLDFKHLERDFNELMESHGYNLTLAEKKEEKFKDPRKCQNVVTAANLTDTSRGLIEKVYRKDFSELGPQFGWVDESPVEKVKNFLMAPFNALTSTYIQLDQTADTLFADLPAPEAGHRD